MQEKTQNIRRAEFHSRHHRAADSGQLAVISGRIFSLCVIVLCIEGKKELRDLVKLACSQNVNISKVDIICCGNAETHQYI
jgi:hypothetical protein